MRRNVLSQHRYVSMEQPRVQSAMYVPTTTFPSGVIALGYRTLLTCFRLASFLFVCVRNVMVQDDEDDDDSIFSRIVCVCLLPTMMCEALYVPLESPVLHSIRIYSTIYVYYVRTCIHVCDTRSDSPMHVHKWCGTVSCIV